MSAHVMVEVVVVTWRLFTVSFYEMGVFMLLMDHYYIFINKNIQLCFPLAL